MKPRFSSRKDDIMQSYIMELIAVAKQPGMISFATGLPDNRLFDVSGLANAAREVLEADDAADALQYGVTEGLYPLREKIAFRCRKELGFSTNPENVLLTNGSQECFDHLGKMFLDRGDGMVVENPGYLGALQSYSAYAPKYTGIDMNENGPDLEQMEAALKGKPKLFYGIPNHQNPSGMSYSEDVRKGIAEMLNSSETLMIEDDAYGELGYGKRAGKSIRSMSENVVLTGSFSKVISPAMRIGWMIVPDWMVEQAKVSIESGCLHSGLFSQKVVDRFLDNIDYDAYLTGLRREYKRKKDLFLDLMEENLPDCMDWNDPAGGMFVWLKSPEGTDAMKLYENALKRKVVVMPGAPFHVRGGLNTIRLNFATADDGQMRTGMKALGEVCKELY